MKQGVGPLSRRAERRAAPKPAVPAARRRLSFVPSKPAQADLEPRRSVPTGDRRTSPFGEGSS